MIEVKETDIVFLTLSSFKGISAGAKHYYGGLEALIGGDRQEVTFSLSKEQAKVFNIECGINSKNVHESFGYQEGEQSERFSSRKSVIVAAKKQFKEHWPKATVLVLGSTCVCEPQEILIGPKEFKDKINVLAARYDKLDWDFESDKEEIKELERKWQELWPRKYF